MIALTSLSQFTVNGLQGYGIVVSPELDGMDTLVGKRVSIDGIEYECIGVERFGTQMGKPLKAGERIGVMVKKEK